MQLSFLKLTVVSPLKFYHSGVIANCHLFINPVGSIFLHFIQIRFILYYTILCVPIFLFFPNLRSQTLKPLMDQHAALQITCLISSNCKTRIAMLNLQMHQA